MCTIPATSDERLVLAGYLIVIGGTEKFFSDEADAVRERAQYDMYSPSEPGDPAVVPEPVYRLRK